MDKSLSVIISTGDACNLRCRYCYVRGEDTDNFSDTNPMMSLSTVEKALVLIKEINAERDQYIHFSYHGGEPLLMGHEFFKSCYRLQKKIFPDFYIDNSIQTNGVLLNENYVDLAINAHFSFGISLDGPRQINDINRFDLDGISVFDKIMANLRMLRENDIQFGILSVVTKALLGKHKELISFLIDNHIERFAVNPCVTDLLFSSFEYTISPLEYGEFLVGLFHEWTSMDNPDLIISNFFYPMKNMMGCTDNICKFSNTCLGYTYTIYPDGDIYVCPSIKRDEFRLGNVSDSRHQILSKEIEIKKKVFVSDKCKACCYYNLCFGACIYERTIKHNDMQPHYFYCEAYRMLFSTIFDYIKRNISTPGLSVEDVWKQEQIKAPT